MSQLTEFKWIRRCNWVKPIQYVILKNAIRWEVEVKREDNTSMIEFIFGFWWHISELWSQKVFSKSINGMISINFLIDLFDCCWLPHLCFFRAIQNQYKWMWHQCNFAHHILTTNSDHNNALLIKYIHCRANRLLCVCFTTKFGTILVRLAVMFSYNFIALWHSKIYYRWVLLFGVAGRKMIVIWQIYAETRRINHLKRLLWNP